MKRNELKHKIADASEGELSGDDLKKLESELSNHPDLKADFEQIMKLPSLNEAFEKKDSAHFSNQIMDIKQAIRGLEKYDESFAEISFSWFRRYALAASVLIMAGSAALYFPGYFSEEFMNEPALEELFMPIESETLTDEYVVYIDELTEE